jgi:hypothetical protein
MVGFNAVELAVLVGIAVASVAAFSLRHFRRRR